MDERRSDAGQHWRVAVVFVGGAMVLALSGFALPIALALVAPVIGVLVLFDRLEKGMAAAPPRPDWLGRAVLSGFVAGTVMLLAFGVAYGVALIAAVLLAGGSGSATGTQVAAWFFNLAHNVVTDMALGSVYVSAGVHLALGTLFALLYGRYVEPRLAGSHWSRGLSYALLPWMLSVVVFLPLAGAGWFGLALGAGPLPFLGNLLLHAVYGITLGLLYGPLGDTLPGEADADDEESDDMHHAEGGAAKGIAAGAAVGLVAGAVVAVALPDLNAAPWQADVVGLALLGSAVGALVGSLFGLPVGTTAHAHS